MTREEARRIAQGLITNFKCKSEMMVEFCNVVIEALEQEPTTKNDLEVDAISRSDVLKLMQDNWHTHNGDWAMQESMDDIRALPSVTPQEPRWIPVTEDAPPKGTICLWCNKQGSVFTSEITYRSECSSHVGKHGYFSNGLENYGNIVAWMPLPKAYREVEE